jgi:hypothetical protein
MVNGSSMSRKPSRGGTRGPRKYLVTVAGSPPRIYDERRLKSLRTHTGVLLWIDDTGETLAATAFRRERSRLTLRGSLGGQGLDALGRLFTEPEQKLDALFPGGDLGSRMRALRRLRTVIDARTEVRGEWELLNVRKPDLVSFRIPSSRLCVLVRPAVSNGERQDTRRADRARLDVRGGIHHHSASLVVVQLRVVNPGSACVAALDPILSVDGRDFGSCDPWLAKELHPGVKFVESFRVDSKDASSWRYVAFDARELETAKPTPPGGDPRLKLRAKLEDSALPEEIRKELLAELSRHGPPWRTHYPSAAVRMKTLDGRTLRVAVPLTADPS